MTVKCILFDATGVVTIAEFFSTQYHREYNIALEEITPFFLGPFQECLAGRADLVRTIKPWLKKWGWKGTDEEFLNFWITSEDKINQGLMRLIKQLRSQGIVCYIATNQEAYRTKFMKEHKEFQEVFNDIFSSSDIGFIKPSKEYFLYALDKLKSMYNLSFEEILLVDDSKKNVERAKELGLRAYLYDSLENFRAYIRQNLN